MRDALSSSIARRDAVLAVPEDRVLRENFGRDIALDLSSEDNEFAALHFPIDRMFDAQIWIYRMRSTGCYRIWKLAGIT
jgi:hypothetical protein